jgi:NTP pyrophosphatase (non-canonical NTP hydrolase)
MLREFFPNTEKGASLYGGFLQHSHGFYKIFDMKGSLEKALKEINTFLEENGYDSASKNDFDETNTYENFPVSIAPHGYHEQFVLFIDRDVQSKTQSEFLINELTKFRDERDWDQFHNPKDLAIALSIESNELLEQFLWKNHEEANREKIKEELADVLAYTLLLADKMGVNIEEIVLDKIKANGEKYPISKAKGSAKKYNEL